MKKVRYAVVGTGWISQIAFMPGLEQTGNSVIAALVSGNPANAAKLAEFYGIKHVFGREAARPVGRRMRGDDRRRRQGRRVADDRLSPAQ